MSFITEQEFTTHIYEEAIEKIKRGDDNKFTEAINTAVGRARRSLGRYDVDLIFAASGNEREKYAELITYIKDIAKFHFIKVANVQVDYQIAEKSYEEAIKELDKIRTGDDVPGWPLALNPAGSTLMWGSAPKFFDERL